MKSARPNRTRLRAAAKASVPSLSDAQVKTIQDRIGYHFKDRQLLVQALTHPSAIASADSVRLSNQRLEFLGDRVLNLLIAERLIERRKTESEGDLAPRLNRFVKKGACAEAFRHFKLQEFLILSDGEIASGGNERESTIGDACEAVIGAIYLDGGLSAARAFFNSAWEEELAQLTRRTQDAKSHLQEWAARKRLAAPVYQLVSRKGPDHRPHFMVEVRIDGLEPAIGEGNTKQAAQRAAADAMLKREHAHDQ